MNFFFTLLLFISDSAFGKTTLHKRTQYFVDIEADQKQVLIDCSDHPETGNSYIGFYLLDGDHTYFFVYRRPLGIKQCHETRDAYLKLVRKTGTARIVGISPDDEKGPMKIAIDTPTRFTNVKKITHSIFIRLQTKDQCKAYFPDDCELPKNYWGGVMPE